MSAHPLCPENSSRKANYSSCCSRKCFPGNWKGFYWYLTCTASFLPWEAMTKGSHWFYCLQREFLKCVWLHCSLGSAVCLKNGTSASLSCFALRQPRACARVLNNNFRFWARVFKWWWRYPYLIASFVWDNWWVISGHLIHKKLHFLIWVRNYYSNFQVVPRSSNCLCSAFLDPLVYL